MRTRYTTLGHRNPGRSPKQEIGKSQSVTETTPLASRGSNGCFVSPTPVTFNTTHVREHPHDPFPEPFPTVYPLYVLSDLCGIRVPFLPGRGMTGSSVDPNLDELPSIYRNPLPTDTDANDVDGVRGVLDPRNVRPRDRDR